MPRRWLIVLVALLLAALALGAVSCGDGEDGAGETATATEAGGQPTPPGNVSAEIVAPQAGATVPRPVILEVRSSGVQIAPASQQVPGAAHYHAFVDREPVAEGEVSPSGEGIYHFTEGSVEILRLEEGEHTITVVLGDNEHVRLEGVPAASVTFTAE